jgi:sialate O-acetylesterase
MVLQRAPASAVVWGFANVGATVVTTFNRNTYSSVAGSDGVWRAHLQPTVAGGPYTISFSSTTGETAAISDVLFGDVYVCGGQSNMQFSVGGNENGSAYAKEAESYPKIRLFTVGQVRTHICARVARCHRLRA